MQPLRAAPSRKKLSGAQHDPGHHGRGKGMTESMVLSVLLPAVGSYALWHFIPSILEAKKAQDARRKTRNDLVRNAEAQTRAIQKGAE